MDEALAHLLSEREAQGGDEPGVPDPERLKALAETHGLDPRLLDHVMRLLDNRPWRQIPRILAVPEGLAPRAVLPLMRTLILGEAKCTLTHAIQLGEASEVYLQVNLTATTQEPLAVQLALDLQVEGPHAYETMRWGGGGGGDRFESRFVVTPELPDDLTGIRFLLTPGRSHERPRAVDVTVTHPTPFPDK